MKRPVYYLMVLCAMLLAAASCKKVNVGGGGSSYVFTDESDNITAISALLHGHYSGPKITDESVGIICDISDQFKSSTSPRQTTIPTEEGKFWITFFDLEPNTVYKYMSFAHMNGKEEQGKEKSFRTLEAVFTDEPQDVNPTAAKLKGHIEEGINLAKVDSYGFIYDPSSGFNLSSSKRSAVTLSGKQFTLSLTDIQPETEYSYVAYIKLKTGKEYYGEQKKFTTGQVQVTGLSVSPTTLTLTLGTDDSYQLKATVSPSNAPAQTLNWTSSSPDVASVTPNGGLVKPLKKGNTTITVSTSDGKFKASCSVTVKTVDVTSITISPASKVIRMKDGKTAQLTATVYPSNATDKSVKWETWSESSATVTQSGLVTAKRSGVIRINARSVSNPSVYGECILYIINVAPSAGVDLGLSVKWAPFDLGASEDATAYGIFVAWGETEPKLTYTPENYTYTGNPTTLPMSADAARVNWGGTWRIPTKAEVQELIDKCTWTWQQPYYIVKGPNGNSIKLPYGGKCAPNQGSESYGYFWTSTRNTSSSYKDAYYLYFMPTTGGNYKYELRGSYYSNKGQCSDGLRIRPVCSK